MLSSWFCETDRPWQSIRPWRLGGVVWAWSLTQLRFETLVRYHPVFFISIHVDVIFQKLRTRNYHSTSLQSSGKIMLSRS